jgi:hypothetical protein
MRILLSVLLGLLVVALTACPKPAEDNTGPASGVTDQNMRQPNYGGNQGGAPPATSTTPPEGTAPPEGTTPPATGEKPPAGGGENPPAGGDEKPPEGGGDQKPPEGGEKPPAEGGGGA